MDPSERRPRHLEMTIEQASAQMRLANGIRALRARGVSVACVEDPEAWDSELTPVKVCAGCPVMDLCTTYAMTGAVTEGVIAGMWASKLVRVLKAQHQTSRSDLPERPRRPRRGDRKPLPSIIRAA